MESPILGIRFVHTAIRRETENIEKLVSGSDAIDPVALGKRVEWLTLMIHLHTEGEEVAMFPRLEEKAPNVKEHYLFDHAAEDKLLSELKELVAAVGTEAGATAKRLRLQQCASALRHHAALHIAKEESIVIPLVQKNFTPPEQGAIVSEVIARYKPDQVREMLPWIINWLEPADREIYVRDMQHAMPPPVFAAAKDWIRSGTSNEVWSDLTKRVPELA